MAKIDRFGIKAILGRDTFYCGELRSLIVAENIYNGYQARKAASNWADWTAENPAIADLLFEAQQLWQIQE